MNDEMEKRIPVIEAEYLEPGYRIRFDERPASKPTANSYRKHIILLGLTILTTLFAGTMLSGADPFVITNLYRGIPYSLSIMFILGVHEMGHFLMCKKHKVNATLPYFIPFPSILGTLGAFIKMKSPISNRRALLDIGAAGPLAGFVAAVPLTVIGFMLSEVTPIEFTDEAMISFGDSILSRILTVVAHPSLPEGHTLMLHPIGFAGYVGLFVTALNLLPIGQLDGGHISYAMFGQKQKKIAQIFIYALLPMGLFFWSGWFIWAMLGIIMGPAHPRPINDSQNLDPLRYKIGIAAGIILLLTLVPMPFNVFN